MELVDALVTALTGGVGIRIVPFIWWFFTVRKKESFGGGVLGKHISKFGFPAGNIMQALCLATHVVPCGGDAAQRRYHHPERKAPPELAADGLSNFASALAAMYSIM